MLRQVIQWARDYESRDDEYGLTRHRRIFDSFSGAKREYTSTSCYESQPLLQRTGPNSGCNPCAPRASR